MKNPIVQKSYYRVSVELASPLCVSGGDDMVSDADVCVNGNGECFVPGSSIAGALRAFTGDHKEEESIFGYARIRREGDEDTDVHSDGRMSAVSVSDLYFYEGVRLSIRDRVSLNDDKTVNNKFDRQIIETGAKGSFQICITERENDAFESPGDAVDQAILAINSGDIRFGGLKNRGFGRMKVLKVASRTFCAEEVETFIKCLERNEMFTENDDRDFQEWETGRIQKPSEYVFIKVPLRLTGGISIRRYSAKPGAADFEHITCNDVPVIPGTSWNGALRSDAKRILRELGYAKPGELIKKWFGRVETGGEDAKAEQSVLVVGESILKNSKRLPISRNKINRFTGATVDGALFQEVACFGGETDLTLMIRKDDRRSYKALIGMMLLVLEDLERGFLAVGGQGTIGRGIFEANGDRVIEGMEGLSEEDCRKELYLETGRQ